MKRDTLVLVAATAMVAASAWATPTSLPPAPIAVKDFAVSVMGGMLFLFPDRDEHYCIDLRGGATGAQWVIKSARTSDDDDHAARVVHEDTVADGAEAGDLLLSAPESPQPGDGAGVFGLSGVTGAAAAASELLHAVFLAGGGVSAAPGGPRFAAVAKAWFVSPGRDSTPGEQLHKLPDLPHAAAFPGASVSDAAQRLVVTGGADLSGTATSAVVSLSLDALDGSHSAWGNWTALPALKHARFGHASVYAADALFVAGGIGADGGSLASVESLSFESPSWTVLQAALPSTVAYGGLVVVDCRLLSVAGAMVPAGGTEANETVSGQVFALDVGSDAPTDAAWKHVSNLTQWVAHAATAAFDGAVFVVGGVASSAGGRSTLDTVQLPSTGATCAVGFTGKLCASCEAGYFGPNCTACPGLASTPCGKPCFGRGTCSGSGTTGGTGECTCEAKYANKDHPDCSHCLPGFAGPESGCVRCAADFYGPTCAPCKGTAATGLACSGHGTCDGGGSTAPSGTGNCSCHLGWAGDACTTCAPGFSGPSCTSDSGSGSHGSGSSGSGSHGSGSHGSGSHGSGSHGSGSHHHHGGSGSGSASASGSSWSGSGSGAGQNHHMAAEIVAAVAGGLLLIIVALAYRHHRYKLRMEAAYAQSSGPLLVQ